MKIILKIKIVITTTVMTDKKVFDSSFPLKRKIKTAIKRELIKMTFKKLSVIKLSSKTSLSTIFQIKNYTSNKQNKPIYRHFTH